MSCDKLSGTVPRLSAGFDQARAGYDPNASRSVLAVPVATKTFLFRVAAAVCEKDARVVGLAQNIEIGCIYGAGGNTFPLRFPQVSKDWSFPDGFVSWHLRQYPITDELVAIGAGTADPPGNRSLSRGYFGGLDPALLFIPAAGGAYLAPGGGNPPGSPLTPDLATFYDLRFPDFRQRLSIPVRGQSVVALFAKVIQTDPASRWLPGDAPDAALTSDKLAALSPEDRFVLAWKAASPVYTAVGGGLLVEDA